MGKQTGIAWTDHTFNPWWGCERVSDGCLHCYAESFAKRTGHAVWGKRAGRRLFGDKHWNGPVAWNAAAKAAGRPALVFCASMADVFDDHPDVVEARERLWRLIDATPWLIWQLLTKRPQNVARLVPPSWVGARPDGMVQIDPTHLVPYSSTTRYERERIVPAWPSNVWIGATVEHQAAAAERLPILDDLPAPVRFLSCEPLLGPVTLHLPGWALRDPSWVIVGGESGPGHRPLVLGNARALVAECEGKGIPVFFKQVGGKTPTAGGDRLDGRLVKQFPAAARRDVPIGIR